MEENLTLVKRKYRIAEIINKYSQQTIYMLRRRIATDCNVGERTVRLWEQIESGHSWTLTNAQLESVARHLNVQVSDLLTEGN